MLFFCLTLIALAVILSNRKETTITERYTFIPPRRRYNTHWRTPVERYRHNVRYTKVS